MAEEKKRELDEELKKFIELQGKSEDWYNGLDVTSDEYKEFIKAFDERKKEAPENESKNDGQPGEEKEKTPEERKAAREEQVPTDEFKEFMEKQYGEGAFDKHYVHGPDEEKDRFEIQYEAITKKSPLREPESITINEIDPNEIETPEAVNTDNSHADEPEWKKMRREAWEKYAADNQQEFKLLSEDKAPDLFMSVGDTPIKYADANHISMGNGEYAKFLQAVEIEVKAGTDVINFGDIKSEDYKSKLAAACLAKGLKMKNGPEMIDLTLECFKDLDEDTKAKIAVYNAEKAAAKEKEKSKEEKKESKEIDTKGKTKEEYAAMYEAKLKDFGDKKTAGENLDFSQIKDPVERVIAYTAAKKSGLKIENLNNNDLLFDEKNNADRTEDVSKALTAMPDEDRGYFNIHEKRVAKLQEVKQLIKDKKLKYGQYRDQDGNVHNSQLSTTVKDADGKAVVNDKGEATRSERVDRYKVEYTKDQESKKKSYVKDENGLYKIRERNGGR